VVVLELGVRARLQVGVRVRVTDAYSTKHLGTIKLGYEMSEATEYTYVSVLVEIVVGEFKFVE